MKIGVLTWFFGNNYGAKAHSFALQEILKSMGHTVEMISYYPNNVKLFNIRMNLNTPHIKYHPIIFLKCLLRCKRFDSWTKKKYCATKKVTTASEIDSLGFDVIIVGSDEVFNYEHKFFDYIYYGVGLQTRLIAYAPSSGQADCNVCFDKLTCESLERFDYLSARDEHTKKLLLTNTKKEIALALDPTLLYEFEIEKDSFAGRVPYILIYSFDTWDIYKDYVKAFAKMKNLKIICIGRRCTWADQSYISADFMSWLSAFKHASYVFTDSFHGVVFSIKNRKQFLIVSRRDKINKIKDLLSQVGINRDFYTGKISVDDYFAEEIDYAPVQDRMSELKKKSLGYLTKALEGRK